MSIPVAETTITVSRTTGETDGYGGAPTVANVVTGVRAVIGTLSGSEVTMGGTQETAMAKLLCDPCDVTYLDNVVDELTGLTWDVVWVRKRVGFGVDHMTGMLRMLTGEPS